MKRTEAFPSKYLRAADLGTKPITVTIVSVSYEKLKNPEGKEQDKTILHFKETKKELPLNMTNWDAVADVTGEDDSDDWPGHKLELYPTTTIMAGQTKACVRIRAPEQGELKPKASRTRRPIQKPPHDDLDDEIPFS